MVGANGSALPIYQHQQPQRLTDHNPHQLDRENEHHQTLNDHHSLKTDRENERGREAPLPISKPPRRVRSVLPSRGPKPLLPRSLKEALQLASLLSKSKLVPKGFENPEACLVGILYGMEVGLSPIAALQRMAIIKGRPTIWGDAALALVEASGLLIKIEERIEILGSKTDERSSDWPHEGKASGTGHQRQDQSDDRLNTGTRTAICQVLRSGRSEPIIRSFSTEDAKRAGLWQKPGPWADYPDRMLMMRARAFALRDAFPDVLMGLYIREEFEGVEAETRYAKPELGSGSDSIDSQTELDGEEKSYLRSNKSLKSPGSSTFGQPIKSTPPSPIRRAPPPPMEVTTSVTTTDKDNILAIKESQSSSARQSEIPAEYAKQSFLNPTETLELFDSALACAKDEETLEEIREEFTERIDRLDSEGLQEAGRIFMRHEKRIRAIEEAFKKQTCFFEPTPAQDISVGSPLKDSDGFRLADDGAGLAKSKDGLVTYEDEIVITDGRLDKSGIEPEVYQDNSFENTTGRIGKESLSPHRRRRFSIRPRKGLSLAELNARRKVDFLKYMPRFRKTKDPIDE